MAACIFAVDLVDDDNRLQIQVEGFLQDELCSRQRTLCCVHKQQHAVHHRQRTLHLAGEVCVTGCIDDVDLEVFVVDGRVLREGW